MAGKIFVNYRRGDARDQAARLRDRLVATLGEAHVFMDVDNLLAGERFDLKLKEALAGTEVFLAVIGARWMELLEERAASGERDFVREEIAAALAAGIPVIPVTMDRAPLPKRSSLPEDIRELALYHKHDVVYESFGRDMAALIEAIEVHRRGRQGQAAEAEGRAAEQQRQEIETARQAREREAAEAARHAQDKERAEAEARRRARELEKAARRERAGVPWMPAAAGLAAVAAIVLAIVYWPHTPAPAATVGKPVPVSVEIMSPAEFACRASVGHSGEKSCITPGSVKAFRDCPDCPEMVPVPAGSFMMGTSPSDKEGDDDERSQHEVRIAKAFAVGKFTVTFDEWKACADDGGCKSYPSPSDSGWGKGRRPVIDVSWSDAQEYVTWLNGKVRGQPYRLLSEAEWEYAARAGTQTRYSWGDSIGNNRANCNGCGSQWDGKQTAPVGSFAPNAFGLYDMRGNVWQWTEDCYKDNYNGAPAGGSALTTGDCSRRVLRGGSWNFYSTFLRSANRYRYLAGYRNDDIGFRLARTLSY
ncbi:MAG: SUMF1/EgtB/PvdO family nonheme iron enzyme [Rhodomicrobium sp.]